MRTFALQERINMAKIEDKDKNTEAATERAARTNKTDRTLAWVSVALAVVSWILLLFSNGYVALGAGIAAVVAGFIAATRNERTLRRVAITATIAAVVLVAVLASFLIVIKIGLGS